MDTFIESLEENGYVVIPGILSDKECNDNIKLVWKWLENLGTGIKQNDPQTWKGIKWPTNIHGIIQHHKIGHTDFAWNVRTHPNVHKVFSKLWNTDKLLVSVDGVCIMKPPELSGYWNRDNIWFHTDQSYRDSKRKCIQGLVTLEEMSSEDGTLKVLLGSHKYHQEFVKYKKEQDSDWKADAANWYKLQKAELDWYLKQDDIKEVRINAPKGSLVLWDSRTIHQNSPPLKERKNPRWRYVIYSCMLPATNIKPTDMAKKLKALKELRMTTHWPYPVYLFPEKPRTYGKVLPTLNIVKELPNLTPLGRKLAGIDQY
jgi:hypothetical protein